MKLEEKVVLISGAGSGIGKSSALLFAQNGATVIVNDINEPNGEQTVEEIVGNGGKAIFKKANVSNADEVKNMIDDIIERFGKIDVLFNNAGIAGVGELHEIEDELFDAVMNINVKGVFVLSKYVIPYMIEKKSGVIINMSSCLAEMGVERRALYAASKGAVLSMTKSMQVDYAKHNIRVNALLPGTIYTPFVERYLKESYEDIEEGLKSITNRQLTDKLGAPEDIAKAALFLASDDSSFVMGSPLYVDGGVVFGKKS
ncbi:SDR family NAD(P)-dependent oxidoreductase [Paenisporosarcina indica]|uniref:SDR family NAD(P)-dependent oxidoreductase n=1 Tax=Paenisporosarcina indica TaxID=650093 RepID=UPI00094FA345|nr:glucose 1-dehydrogenase [Paenisporosarcina indica]